MCVFIYVDKRTFLLRRFFLSLHQKSSVAWHESPTGAHSLCKIMPTQALMKAAHCQRLPVPCVVYCKHAPNTVSH